MNRRNLYRMLHVQPDAPVEVLRAAYRALMARHHPDRGGGHEHAALLNEAWAVLGDPARRAAYDAKRLRSGSRAHAGAEARSAPPPPRPPPREAPRDPVPPDGRGCPFCGAANPPGTLACQRCTAPLSRFQRNGTGAPGMERRRLPRVSRADWGTMRLRWQGDAIDIRLRNLSLDGVGFYAGAALAPGARVRLTAAAFDAVVDIIRCDRHGAIFLLRGAFVTVRVADTSGPTPAPA
jgi:curved DNA-binding protein CbpA